MRKYLLDTCIWMDFFENRISLVGNPIGQYATALINKIIKSKNKILFSNTTIKELKTTYSEQDINYMLNLLFISGKIIKIEISEKTFKEAKNLSIKRNLPLGDCLYAIQARDNNAIMITRDKHFLII